MPKGDVRLRAPGGGMNRIGPRVKERRRLLRLNQDDLCARLSDVTGGGWEARRHEVAALELAERMVSTEELVALGQALECDPCWLLTGQGPGEQRG